MKKVLLILIPIFVLINYSIAQQNNKTLIGFYNLENYYDTINDPNVDDEEFTPDGLNAYTGKVFKEKVENLTTVISKIGTNINPDGLTIFGVAEIENEDVLKVLAAHPRLKNRNYKIVHFNSPDKRGIDVGLFYQAAHFKVLNASAIPVVLDELGDNRPTRDILFVSGKLDGEVIHIFVNHWPSRSGGEAASAPKRIKAAKICKKIIDSLTADNPNAKAIVMGDLNDDPINESTKLALNGKFKIKDVKTPKAMYNPFFDFYKEGIGTIAYQDAWGLFDQIILSYGLVNKSEGYTFDHAEVYNQSYLVEKFGHWKGYPKRAFSGGTWNNGYSDHFPTFIVLKK
ncbi:MAG: endonuclease/exonuclease/phosphatase [Chitinophagaceae bacterium]|nr:endonuclease/exonuclease/phosphatase [Chitinophagaceae bacterium]